jgi:hypothetical protein
MRFTKRPRPGGRSPQNCWLFARVQDFADDPSYALSLSVVLQLDDRSGPIAAALRSTIQGLARIKLQIQSNYFLSHALRFVAIIPSVRARTSGEAKHVIRAS